MTCFSRLFDSYRFSNTFMCSFLLVFWLATLAFILVLELFFFFFLNFQIKCSSYFVEIVFPFYFPVNSECGAYLAVDHSLVYSYPKTFLLYLSLILSLIPDLRSSFSIHISVSCSLVFCS